MDKEKRLIAEQSKLKAEEAQLLATLDAADRGPTPDEVKRSRVIDARLNFIARELAGPDNSWMNDLGKFGIPTRAELDATRPRRPVPGERPTFAELFPNVELSDNGFADLEQYLGTVHSGLADNRLYAAQRDLDSERRWLRSRSSNTL